MFEWSVQNSFEIALTAAVLVVGAMFLEACWRAATDDLLASDKWIKSELSAIIDEEIRTLLKELLINHTARQAKVLTRSIFKHIYRNPRTTIWPSRQNDPTTDLSYTPITEREVYNGRDNHFPDP